MSESENPISPQDRAELTSLQQTASQWRDAILRSVGTPNAGMFDFNAYRIAMQFYENQAKKYAEKYPDEPWIKTMIQQAEEWQRD